MGRYAFERAIQALVALFILVTIVFVLTRMTGNPVDLLLPSDATQADRAYLTHQLGLDRSYPIQYLEFVGNAIRGNLGNSLHFQVPVGELIAQRLPNSLKLVGFGFLIAFSIGIPLGVIAGTHRGGKTDKLTSFLVVGGIAAPNFWVALVLIQVFAVEFGVLPSSRIGDFSHYILPGVSLAFMSMAGMTRFIRSSMIDVQDSDFIKLARIKGVSQRSIVWKHGLRNALIPAMTFGGMQMALLIGGSIVIETIFAWPGTGRLAYEGIIYRDYPLVQAVVLINGTMIVVLNLIVDLLYSVVDPRIRRE